MTFRKLDLFPSSGERSLVQWLRLALPKGPNGVDVFPLTRGRKQIQFPKHRVFYSLEYRTIEKVKTKSSNSESSITNERISVVNRHNGRSRDGVVSIATGYGLDDSPGRVKHFLFSTSSRFVLGLNQRPIQCVSGALSRGREADHSPPTTAEVKNTWIYTSTPPYVFMA
jgi:hypothetical protein